MGVIWPKRGLIFKLFKNTGLFDMFVTNLVEIDIGSLLSSAVYRHKDRHFVKTQETPSQMFPVKYQIQFVYDHHTFSVL